MNFLILQGVVKERFLHNLKTHSFLFSTKLQNCWKYHKLASYKLSNKPENDKKKAITLDPEYFIYHCRHRKAEYEGIEHLLATGKPVIIAHPLMMGTDLRKLPRECYVEINNRYVWRNDWRRGYKPFMKDFRFVFSSDAHQPNWLNQNISKYVARELGVEETIIF